MPRYTNQTCIQLVVDEQKWAEAATVEDGMESLKACCKPVWYVGNVRVNTPYCEEHARQASDARYRNAEAQAL